ncbi:MAG: FecR domain-containing protein [Verrucomicrobia bacterium]|nr:FecR domain-containing protein [Verrucomicrobiota bacterium]
MIARTDPSPRILSGLCRLAWLVGFAFTVIEVAGQASAAATDSGAATVLTIEGKVEVFNVGAADWSVAHTNQVLQAKDLLRTGLKSRATIRLSNQSVLRVNQLTTLEIQPPTAPARPSILDLKKGTTYLFNRDAPAEVEFRTPLASGAIRGTEFNIDVSDEGRTVVTMIDGQVELSNPQGQLSLASNEQGIVEAGKAPTKTAVLETINIIQWSLYYPGVLDVDELKLSAAEAQALADSLAAYRAGDLLQAVARYPDARQPASNAEKIYLAALQISVGQVPETEALLNSLSTSSPLAAALRKLIAAVKFQPFQKSSPPQLATEWLVESYYQQSRSKLEEARAAARQAAAKSPRFGFAQVRVAQMEFSFGRTAEALAALDQGLQLSPRNAQAFALKGFLLAAQNRIAAATEQFEHAIVLDGALGNAWLGRGLCKIRRGQTLDGRRDLQVAATLEPNRAVLRSYLGKAFSNQGDLPRAGKELELAKRFDPNDPTAWLYSALLKRQSNRINEAVDDLERSQELNDNHSVFRSRMLLDQDRAVRSANLAAVYRDAGMFDVSVREATRAVNADYGNYSAHLFLANSYNELRDPRQINLRYETPWFSELLLANLLAPVGASTLSQYVSQQEYSRLLERDGVGVSSVTEYLSSGDWLKGGSHYGTFGDFGYAFDVTYRTDNGQRPNNDLFGLTASGTFKYQLTPQDSLFIQALYYDFESGDVAQYYRQSFASQTQRVTEKQEPNLFLGYHHEWSPGVHTLFLAGRLNDTLTRDDRNAPIRVFSVATNGVVSRVNDYSQPLVRRPNDLAFRTELEAYSVDAQQVWKQSGHTVIAGGRYQTGSSDTRSHLSREPNTDFPVFLQTLDLDQENTTDLRRGSVYGYYSWQALDALQLTAGVSYDTLRFPRNIDIAPITDGELDKSQVSPKAGILWTPWKDGAFRGSYTRSLGGVFYDTSVRLEPTQVAGLNQAFRSMVPESVAGLVPGSRFETWGASFEQKLPSRTYVSVAGEVLYSEASRGFGVFDYFLNTTRPLAPSLTFQRLGFEEKSITVTANQLVGDHLAFGASYKLSAADLLERWPDVPATAVVRPTGLELNRDVRAVLHQLNLYGIATHRCGAFGQFEGVWNRQSNHGYATDLPGDDFWQLNAYLGYRFPRRYAEIRVGLLNLTDQDYRLNPLNLHLELPRERTLVARLKFNF